jgi:RNase P protein component
MEPTQSQLDVEEFTYYEIQQIGSLIRQSRNKARRQLKQITQQIENEGHSEELIKYHRARTLKLEFLELLVKKLNAKLHEMVHPNNEKEIV